MAAISFLNPAPLLYDFEHELAATELRRRYAVHYTLPALCAEQLRTGEADLGLVPVGALPEMPELAVVPGCTIASLKRVRSIQLVVRPGLRLEQVRTVAADNASRSSAAYTRVMFRAFYGCDPVYTQAPARLEEMLRDNDAALLIGDPALLALEARDGGGSFGDHTWHDVAELWRQHTGLPWVAAVWAVRPESLAAGETGPARLAADLVASRDAGMANVDRIVRDWEGRIAVPAGTIRTYMTENIHYRLDADCLAAIARFYALAAETGVLPEYRLRLLEMQGREFGATSGRLGAS